MFDAYDDICGVNDAAEMLHMKPYRIYKLIRDGEIRRLNVGKPYLITKTEIIRFVQQKDTVKR